MMVEVYRAEKSSLEPKEKDALKAVYAAMAMYREVKMDDKQEPVAHRQVMDAVEKAERLGLKVTRPGV